MCLFSEDVVVDRVPIRRIVGDLLCLILSLVFEGPPTTLTVIPRRSPSVVVES